jgi:hypothetical protein
VDTKQKGASSCSGGLGLGEVRVEWMLPELESRPVNCWEPRGETPPAAAQCLRWRQLVLGATGCHGVAGTEGRPVGEAGDSKSQPTTYTVTVKSPFPRRRQPYLPLRS